MLHGCAEVPWRYILEPYFFLLFATYPLTVLCRCAILQFMNHGHIVRLLEKCRGERTWKEVAVEIGVSESFLSRVRGGWCGPGEKILTFLNLREEISYVKLERK
jgi:hypothetical protein